MQSIEKVVESSTCTERVKMFMELFKKHYIITIHQNHFC
jgi:hypothetical protein